MSTFQYDPALIDRYLDESQILEFGIDYYLYEDPKRTREEAAVLAHAYTQKYCRRWCSRDRRDPASRHVRAFDSFVEKVNYGQYFNSPRRQKATEAVEKAKRDSQAHEARQQREKEENAKAEKLKLRQQDNERRRVTALRERCVANGLDFEKENIRQLKRQYFKQQLLTAIACLFALPTIALIIFAIIFAFIFQGMPANISLDWPYVVAIVIGLVSWVPGMLIMRGERNWLPDEAFEVIGKKKKGEK